MDTDAIHHIPKIDDQSFVSLQHFDSWVKHITSTTSVTHTSAETKTKFTLPQTYHLLIEYGDTDLILCVTESGDVYQLSPVNHGSQIIITMAKNTHLYTDQAYTQTPFWPTKTSPPISTVATIDTTSNLIKKCKQFWIRLIQRHKPLDSRALTHGYEGPYSSYILSSQVILPPVDQGEGLLNPSTIGLPPNISLCSNVEKTLRLQQYETITISYNLMTSVIHVFSFSLHLTNAGDDQLSTFTNVLVKYPRLTSLFCDQEARPLKLFTYHYTVEELLDIVNSKLFPTQWSSYFNLAIYDRFILSDARNISSTRDPN